jgi:hypothetical protein
MTGPAWAPVGIWGGLKMKLRLFAMAAAAALIATSASAAVTSITSLVGNAVPAGETLITDFNSTGGTVVAGGALQGGTIVDLAPGFTFTQDFNAYTRDGVGGLNSGVSAPPPLNNGVAGAYYETVLGGGSATLTSLKGLKTFSFYMGSPDTFNHVKFTFYGVGGGTQTLNGQQIWGGAPSGDGNQSQGFTIVYTFGPEAVNKITFTSDTNAFEFDKLAGTEVPEPATWAMMLMGFGGIGALLRRRRQGAAFA